MPGTGFIIIHAGVAQGSFSVRPGMAGLRDDHFLLLTGRLEIVGEAAEKPSVKRVEGLRIPLVQAFRFQGCLHLHGNSLPGLFLTLTTTPQGNDNNQNRRK